MGSSPRRRSSSSSPWSRPEQLSALLAAPASDVPRARTDYPDSARAAELPQAYLRLVGRERTALAALPAAEVVITGHTDRVGAVEANDRLSLARAEAVREILVAGGLARSAITVAGRGEREPAVATADEVAEARNRRVEIKIR